MGYHVGIDLGTTFSVVAYINPETGKPEVIKNTYGETTTPSILCFEKDGTILFGQDAKEEKALGNPNTASFFKREMGNLDIEYEYWDKLYTPEDLSSILLSKLIGQAEERLGDQIDEAVITVPAYFSSLERSRTLRAGERAGIKVSGIISEPSAAAFAYGLQSKQDCTVLIYDLGGGTFDVSVAKITSEDIDILGTAGDHHLGGKDWDEAIVFWLEEKFEEQFGEKIEYEPEIDAMIMEVAEKAKKELSARKSTWVRFKQNGNNGKYELTQEVFSGITSYQLDIAKNIVEKLFVEIGKDKGESFGWDCLDGVILVGGSTRMKMVEEYVRNNLGREPMHGVNPDEAVALGAAIRANIDDKGHVLPKVLNMLGSRPRESRDVIGGGRKIQDAIAHSLGMVAENETGTAYVNSIIIKKNAHIPAEAKKAHTLKTSPRGENELEVYLLQGEEKEPLYCRIAGKYIFHGIKHVPGGAKITVSYRYNQNGIIDVEAMQDGRILDKTEQEVPEDVSWMGRPPEHPAPSPAAVDIYLMIDLSYSMKGSMTAVNRVIYRFVSELDMSMIRLCMIGVADRAEVLQELTSDVNDLKKVMNRLEMFIESGKIGFGNDSHPFHLLMREVKRNETPERKSIGIILADGQWGDDAVEGSYRCARECHEYGIETVALGFSSANEKFLRDISSMKDLSALKNLNQLTENFSKIARVIGNGLVDQERI